VLRTAGRELALAVTALFSVAPLIFDYSRDVMLEMPSLSLVLLAVDRFDAWLTQRRTRELYLAATAAAAAALTRFDSVVLLPFVLFRVAFTCDWRALRSRHVVSATLLALLAVGPVYAIIAREAGSLHMQQAATSVGGSEDGSVNGWLSPKNFAYYPMALVAQCGWPVALLCGAGLLLNLSSTRRRQSAAWLALFLATYVTFTPLAELRARHAIYWVPAAAFFAVQALSAVLAQVRSAPRIAAMPLLRSALPVVAYGLLLASTATAAMNQRTYRVTGYATAARFALERTAPGHRVFFDGWWDGNFTYQLRHLDPTRSRHVVRGDRLLYDFVCIPDTGFQTFADSDRRMVELLLEADPRLIVIENPQFYRVIPVAQQLRELIAENPHVFVPLQHVPVESSLTHLPAFRLEVFRFESDEARGWLQRQPAVESATHSIPTNLVTDPAGETP
jgi:hypothetical protein